mgnify:CR=1 FL=1
MSIEVINLQKSFGQPPVDVLKGINFTINDGDLILVRSADSATEWQIVVALIDDEATIKRIHYDTDYISLNPNSTNEKHKPIILHEDFRIQWIYVRSFPSNIF